MNPKVAQYLEAKEREAAAKAEEEKKKILLDAGLFEREYTDANNLPGYEAYDATVGKFYRDVPIEVTEELAIPVQFKFGIYMSTGALTMAHPFLIDITGKGDLSLTAETDAGRPVKSMSLIHLGIRDTIWSKKYAEPAADVSEVLSDGVDMLRGFEQNQVDGHQLTVTYADGTAENVSAPQENAFQWR